MSVSITFRGNSDPFSFGKKHFVGHKENSKVMSFERDEGCLCDIFGCTFVLAIRNTEKPLLPLK